MTSAAFGGHVCEVVVVVLSHASTWADEPSTTGMRSCTHCELHDGLSGHDREDIELILLDLH